MVFVMNKLNIALFFNALFFSAGAFSFEQARLSNDSGYAVAENLTQQYNNMAKDCGDAQSPAFLCSGVIIRGIRGSGYNFWSINPASKVNNGVSFSYLRKDAKFSNLFESRRGFILFPNRMRPLDTVDVPVLCSYPVDANTWNRGIFAQNYCGVPTLKTNPKKDYSCQDFGITTKKKYKNSFMLRGGWGVCAMDVRATAVKPAEGFLITLEVMRSRLGLPYNEIVLKPWDDAKPHNLPVEALFSINGLELNEAKKDQRDYKDATGKFIPIIRIKLPSNSKKDAVFTYEPKDQIEIYQ